MTNLATPERAAALQGDARKAETLQSKEKIAGGG